MSTAATTTDRPTWLTGPVGITLLVLAWGSTFSAVEVGLDHAPPILFGGIRSVLGGSLVAVIAWVRSGPPDLRRTWRIHASLTWWSVIVFFALQTLAIEELPSGLAAVLIYLQPLLVAVVAWRFLGESMGLVKVAGLLLGFAGIVLVSGGAFQGHISPKGLVYAVVGAVAWTIGTVVFKRHQAHIDVPWAIAIPFTLGGVVLTILGAATEGTTITWSPAFVGALAYASIIGTAMSWGLWLGLVAAGEASRASAYIFMVPVVAVILGVLLLDETFRPSLAVGSVLVVAGIFLVNRRVRATAGAL